MTLYAGEEESKNMRRLDFLSPLPRAKKLLKQIRLS